MSRYPVYVLTVFLLLLFSCSARAEHVRSSSQDTLAKKTNLALPSNVYAYSIPGNLPQGAPWFIVEKFGTVWLAGDSGLIAKTQPGNLTQWTLMNSGIPADVQIGWLEFVNTQIVFAAGGNGSIYKSTDGGSTWNLCFYDPSVTDFINVITFFDANHGAACGDGSTTKPMAFLETTDGGTSWVNNNTFTMGFANYNVVRFVAPSDAFMSGYVTSGNSTYRVLWRSPDLGKTWQYRTIGVGTLRDFATPTYGLDFRSDLSGLVCRADSTFWYTTDAGNTWSQIGGQTATYYNCVDFVEGTNSAICGGRNQAALAEVDAGVSTFTELRKDSSSSLFLSLGFTYVNYPTLSRGYMISGGRLSTFYATQSPTEAKAVHNLPIQFGLAQNYPNPFNPSTTINYSIASRSYVTISVFNSLGQKIADPVKGEREAGTYDVKFETNGLSSGIYLYQMKAGSFVQAKKMIVVK